MQPFALAASVFDAKWLESLDINIGKSASSERSASCGCAKPTPSVVTVIGQLRPEGFEKHPIYGEFEVENNSSGTGLKGGNFREGLVFFDVLKNGNISGNPCFDRFCISEINPIDANTFVITVNGETQKFVSTEGLKPLEW